MSNIGWNRLNNSPTTTPAVEPKRKVPYTQIQRTKDDMPADQKAGIERWNLMIAVLKENDLMENKD